MVISTYSGVSPLSKPNTSKLTSAVPVLTLIFSVAYASVLLLALSATW